MKRSNSESRRAGFTNAGLELSQPSYDNTPSLGTAENSNGIGIGIGGVGVGGADNIGMTAANNGSNATIATAILTGPNAGTLTGGRFAGDSAGATTTSTANRASESLAANNVQGLEAQPAPPLNSSENNFGSGPDHHQHPRNNNQHIARQSQTDVPSVGFHSHRQNSNSSRLPAFRFAELSIVPSSLSHTSLAHRVAQSSNRASDDSVALSTTSGPSIPRDRSNEPALRSASLPRSALASSTVAAVQDTPSRPAPFRSSTYDIPSSPPPSSPLDQLKRSTSYPIGEPLELSAISTTGSHSRRGSTARVSFDFAASDDPPSALRAQRAQAAEAAEALPDSAVDSEQPSSIDSESGQRELLQSKRHSQSSPPPDGKRVCRPPVSYKPPANAPPTASAPVRVPPIRGFRSSGSRRSSGASRKSQNLDMNFTQRPYDLGVDTSDTNGNNFDRTIRALEGRPSQDAPQMSSPTSARRENPDGDDGGDLFLRIAREEVSRRTNDGNSTETQNSVPRFMRSAHRRPMSTTVAAVPTSPTFPGRRLSEQQDSGRGYDDDRASEIVRSISSRVQLQDKASSVHPADDTSRSSRASNSGSLRPSPIAARQHQFNFSDPDSPSFNHSRRHSSVNDQTTPPITRSVFKFTPQAKSYNSSPLVKSFDFGKQNNHDGPHGVEGTDSTSSTNAPSTVWDELDELKSRLHRLELTGKLPATSGAAVSKASDERPPTATTTMTTMSSSPKRNGAQIAETGSTTSSQREATHKDAYPILVSALAKSRAFLNPEVYRALESAANDAMVLSSLLGVAGQPGPISSGASAIGSATNVTDRQLRRKADGVCRSLTELCVALGEDTSQNRSTQAEPARSQQTYHTDAPKTPTVAKTYNGLTSGRRPSVQVDTQNQPAPRVVTSPNRPFSKFEERRQTLLNGLTSPRGTSNFNATSPQQDPSANRRSSLLITRTRRAGTEEPEDSRDQGTRSSLFRTRARTEEPEDTSGRKTSMLRSRRGTMGDGEDENARFGAPLRAYTEVASSRGPAREYTEIATSRGPARDYTSRTQGRIYGQTREQREQREQREIQTQTIESKLPQASSLPRRRFGSSNMGGVSLSGAPSALPTSTRKYFDRASTSNDRDRHGVTSPVDRYPEDRNRRPMSLGGNLSLNRSGSLSSRRQDRDSTVTIASTTATAGNYR